MAARGNWRNRWEKQDYLCQTLEVPNYASVQGDNQKGIHRSLSKIPHKSYTDNNHLMSSISNKEPCSGTLKPQHKKSSHECDSDSDTGYSSSQVFSDEYEKGANTSDKENMSFTPGKNTRAVKIDIGEIMNARKLLRDKGPVTFLREYLPEQPAASDLMKILKILGDNREEPEFDFEDINELQQLLNVVIETMDNVLESRDKLPHVNLPEDVVDLINKSSKIVVVTGAGISTSLGIPDFRSSNGLYNFDLYQYGFTRAEEMFDYETFKDDPRKFFKAAHLIIPVEKRYTPLHGFIRQLDLKDKLLRNYSQNIDGLEDNAGIDPEKIIRCHGSFNTASCQTPGCDYSVPGTKIFRVMKQQVIPVCPRCKKEREKVLEEDTFYKNQTFGVVKPDITFFGENLPKRYFDNVQKDLDNCDLLLVIGTSFQVGPVNLIATQAPHYVPQILMNKDPVNHCDFDVNLLGYCDQIATFLCQKLGWSLNHEDFEKIKRSGLRAIGDENAMGIYNIVDKAEWETLKA